MNVIIWDWNGTLLNDLDLCISTINKLLTKRNLPLLDNNTYKEAFSFPVEKYYRTIGFDFNNEDFSVMSKEFIDMYDEKVSQCDLHSYALDILEWFRSKGIRQFILSAMKHSMLVKTLKDKGIYHFFEAVSGLNDHFAVSKIEKGEQLLNEYNIRKESTYIIGDTDHDFEVARTLGIKSILVADGHQSEKKLSDTGAKVVASLNNLKDLDLFS
jgi:phosphoglycolate phosphatase